jgi:hypothetical protein
MAIRTLWRDPSAGHVVTVTLVVPVRSCNSTDDRLAGDPVEPATARRPSMADQRARNFAARGRAGFGCLRVGVGHGGAARPTSTAQARKRRALPCEALPPRRTSHACRSRWFKPNRPRAGEAVVRAASDRRAAQAPRQWRPAVRRCHRRRPAIDPTTTLGLWRGAQRESSSCVLADNGWLEGKSCVYRGVHRVTAGGGHGSSRRRPGPATSTVCSSQSCPAVSLHRAPPAPFEASAILPPPANARLDQLSRRQPHILPPGPLLRRSARHHRDTSSLRHTARHASRQQGS